MSAERTTWSDFGRTVRAHVARELDREREDAAALVARTLPLLEGAIARARAAGMCGRAWLFGSFAEGFPSERSDIDLLLEDCPEPFQVAGIVADACGREVHAVPFESAPESLRERVLATGRPL